VDNETDPHAMMNLDCTSHSPAYSEFLQLFGVDLSNLKFAPQPTHTRVPTADNTPDDATCTAATCTPSEAEELVSASASASMRPFVCEEVDDEFSPRLTCTPLYVLLILLLLVLLLGVVLLLCWVVVDRVC
jgi:hypothetical protein